MIQELRRFQATDERDKIYSALGLVNRFIPDGLDDPIHPDYTIEPADLYTSVTELLIAELPSLSTLSYVTGKTQDLPSWVPDYSRALSRVPLVGLASGNIFSASLIPSISRPQPRFSGPLSHRELTLAGSKFAKVSTRGICLEEMRTNPAYLKTNISLCLSVPQTYKPTNQHRTEALWRTLITDTTERPTKYHPALQEYAAYFHDWLLYMFSKSLSSLTRARMQTELNDICKLLIELTDSSGPNPVDASCLPTRKELSASIKSGNAFRSDGTERKGFYLFDRAFRTISSGRCLFVTEEGHLGLGPESLEKGDEVWVLQGARVPFVLRENWDWREEGTYKVVGEAYVHGVMHGEMVEEMEGLCGEMGELVLC
jgi:hypothetical protein